MTRLFVVCWPTSRSSSELCEELPKLCGPKKMKSSLAQKLHRLAPSKIGQILVGSRLRARARQGVWLAPPWHSTASEFPLVSPWVPRNVESNRRPRPCFLLGSSKPETTPLFSLLSYPPTTRSPVLFRTGTLAEPWVWEVPGRVRVGYTRLRFTPNVLFFL